MTSDSIDTEMAWEDFKEKRSFEKAASVQGQLDTMAAMLQDIQTNTQRTASVIDQINGDNAAIDYEAENADPMAGMEPPMEGPMPGAEDMSAPEEGMEDAASDDVAPELPPEAEGMSAADIPPEEAMAPEGDEVSDEELDQLLAEPAPEEAPAEEGPAGFEPAVDDIVGKIKNLIANTDDPQTLMGLSDLLSSALAQNQPAPMESFAYSDATDTTTEDVNDGLSEIKKEISDCVDSTLGEDSGSFVKKDGIEGVADAEDAKEVEDTTDVKLDDGPEAETSGGKEPFAESDDEEMEVIFEEDDPAPEASAGPIVEEITDKVAEAVEGIVESVLGEGEEDTEEDTEDISEETESFEECDDKPSEPVLKSFSELWDERPRFSTVDGSMEIKKSIDAEPIEKACGATGLPVENESTQTTEAFADSDDVPEQFSNVKEQLDKEDEEKASVADKFSNVERGGGEVNSYTKSAEDSGKHIASFSEMYGNGMGFTKTASPEISRPGRASMVNGVTDKPTLDPIKKSAVPSFEQMMVDREQRKYQ